MLLQEQRLYNISLVTQVTMENTGTSAPPRGSPGTTGCVGQKESLRFWSPLAEHLTSSMQSCTTNQIFPKSQSLQSHCSIVPATCIFQALQAAPSLQDTLVFAVILLLPDPVILKVSSLYSSNQSG